MQKRYALTFFAVILAASVGFAHISRYEILNKSNGEVARLDRWTGDIQICDASACIRPPLVHINPDGSEKAFLQSANNAEIKRATTESARTTGGWGKDPVVSSSKATGGRDLFKEIEEQKP